MILTKKKYKQEVFSQNLIRNGVSCYSNRAKYNIPRSITVFYSATKGEKYRANKNDWNRKNSGKHEEIQWEKTELFDLETCSDLPSIG